MLNTTEDMVHEQLKMLQGRNLIREQEPGKWVRKVLDEENRQVRKIRSSQTRIKENSDAFWNYVTV